MRPDASEEAFHSLDEEGTLRQQAEHEDALDREVEEVARVNGDAVLLEQTENEILLGEDRRNPQHGAPPSAGFQHGDRGDAGCRLPERREVAAAPVQDRRAHRRPLAKKRGQRELDRCGH